jgi:nicotinamide phosphoribosyltransferase
MNPLLLTDFYKIHHTKMYPDGMTKLYSNFTPRKSRIEGVDKVVVFGIQHFVLEYLIKQFNESFFGNKFEEGLWNSRNYDFKRKIISEYQRHCNVDTTHIEALWDLGYLPIEIKALDEGTLCPIGVPMMTITNTHPDFAWLVNYLETLLSACLWQAITSATIAYEYKKLLTKYCLETDEKNIEFVQWQGHDFSMRGMSSVESAIFSGMGHLTSFTGTDTIPAIYQLETSYKAEGLIGASVPATEHSVMCMGTKESEIETFRRLLNLYPTGILSVVSDTWDLWKVCTEYLPQLKEEILARDGKLVIRPDSGDPVDIICGTLTPYDSSTGEDYHKSYKIREKGVIELLWDVFGGTINEQEYKVLDSHIGAIYGDSITLERAVQICERLKAKGFASTNIVLGIGSYTYQYNTRDTFGFAMKATYGEIKTGQRTVKDINGKFIHVEEHIEPREIFKDPITDDGTKKSKKGLLRVSSNKIENRMEDSKNGYPYSEARYADDGSESILIVLDQQTWEQEQYGLLTTVFKDGKLVKQITLEEIRNKLNNTK